MAEPYTPPKPKKTLKRKRSQPERDGIDMDEPFPPPAALRRKIPNFQGHGPQNCGDHHHRIMSSIAETRYKAHFPFSSMTWTCVGCLGDYCPINLHDLPCGHFFCLNCLNHRIKVLPSRLGIYTKQLNDTMAEMVALEDQPRRKRMPATQRREVEQTYSRLKFKLLHYAGLECCGMDTKLNRFVGCLSPGASRTYWLCSHWLFDRPHERRSCAWPDCEQYIPVLCRWELRPSLGGGDGQRYYCVQCRANSRDSSQRVLVSPQTKFPWLPEGQDLLLPSR
ncbi:hypothetical protein B0T26DRAFT_865373 [Lasiosphaeria miniovina]|uniref:RING-type domain-containing protein n=1 Tax=Lasiosphaeria miniovina TaxID=1954250 RepID=A0AA39ZQ90_9PEZI|nr:uncharacterized protein B0T26DRAFT_865373 [Lasiosphaeria miniovina]KAK0701589.1 hypothetical protein B0T26DRAFT_865373 [Lasiosphaeria miniovina]